MEIWCPPTNVSELNINLRRLGSTTECLSTRSADRPNHITCLFHNLFHVWRIYKTSHGGAVAKIRPLWGSGSAMHSQIFLIAFLSTSGGNRTNLFNPLKKEASEGKCTECFTQVGITITLICISQGPEIWTVIIVCVDCIRAIGKIS